MGEGSFRKSIGNPLIIMSAHNTSCKLCKPFQNKVLIDDVYSGGTQEDGDYMLLSEAMERGLYHPRCKHGCGTYYPEIEHINQYETPENKLNDYGDKIINAAHIDNMIQRYKRLVAGSVDKNNIEKYQNQLQMWENEREKILHSDLTNIGSYDNIISGAISGARNPFSDEAKEHARKYYGLVRSMKTDVSKISKTTGISEKDVQTIKNFIFYEKHDLGGSELEYFEPDYMMAESWQRLIDGKPEPHDITLLKHELMEKELMSQGFTQEKAHIETSKKYNYSKEAREYYAKVEKHKTK